MLRFLYQAIFSGRHEVIELLAISSRLPHTFSSTKRSVTRFTLRMLAIYVRERCGRLLCGCSKSNIDHAIGHNSIGQVRASNEIYGLRGGYLGV
jgi:hypothetical protein